MLKLEGFNVATALNAETGLELADSVRPDAIILDMRMPITNGLQFLRLVRSKPHLVEVPIAIVTGDYFLPEPLQTEIKSLGASTFGLPVAVHPRHGDTAWFVPAVKDECRVPVDAKLVVARTRDGGKSFSVLRKGLPQENAYDLVYRHGLDVDASGNLLAFGSTTGGLWLSEDQGDSWRCLSAHLPPIHCVRFG